MAQKKMKKHRAGVCEVCNVWCMSIVSLYDHVTGKIHRAKTQLPGLPHLHKLQDFFDTYVKVHAVVGLEYLHELQGPDTFEYRCQLCGFFGDRKLAVLHLTALKHISRYLTLHHPALWEKAKIHRGTKEYAKVLQEMAKQVFEKHGLKRIKEITVGNPSLSMAAKYSSNYKADRDPRQVAKFSNLKAHSNTSLSTEAKSSSNLTANGNPSPTMVAKSSGDMSGPEAAKSSSDYPVYGYPDPRGRPREDDDHRLPEFKDNADFLDYLEKFEIHNDDDAALIQRITQNCTQALVRFREEQKQLDEQAGPPTVKGVNFGSITPASQEVTMDLFFSSIKNMEESEVLSVLSDIAATNPAFRGIDVPNVVKYLQVTGRLKTS